MLGGNPSQGSVALNGAAPAGGIVVTLSSSNTAVATVPASVTVAAGATSATFTVTTRTVTSSTSITISASYGGATQTASLTVTPSTILSSLTLNPTSVVGGNSSQGTVTLNGPAPSGGAVVTLSSSNTAVATVPASVTVPAGATSATFTVTTSAVTTATSSTISASYGGATATATLTVQPSIILIPQTGWSLQFVDSQELVGENGAAVNSFDANPSTFWVTQWFDANPPPPHEIQINLGATYSLTGFQYLPRQDGCSNGWVNQYELYVSQDGVNWGTPVASGIFDYGSATTGCPGASAPLAIRVTFMPTPGHYVRLRALSEINGNPWTSMAELNLLAIR